MRVLIGLSLALVLTACGPLNEGRGTPAFLSQLLSTEDTSAAPAIPPEIANAGPGEVLLVTLRARGAVAPMLRTGQNGNRVTWASPGKVSMTFEDGILISTRGLGDDLMGADIGSLASAIRAGSGTVQRKHSYLNSLDQIVTNEVTCTITSGGTETVGLLAGPANLRKVTERCEGRRLVFENTYWLRGSQIIKSLQAIAPSQGFIETEQL